MAVIYVDHITTLPSTPLAGTKSVIQSDARMLLQEFGAVERKKDRKKERKKGKKKERNLLLNFLTVPPDSSYVLRVVMVF